MDLVARIQKLKSAWGVLSVGTVLFPGAAYWLDVKSIKSSPLNDYYLLTAIPLGALALLLTLMLAEGKPNTTVRNTAVILALAVVPFSIIGFVTASVGRIDSPFPKQGPEICLGRIGTAAVGDGYQTFTYQKAGRIAVVRHPCECIFQQPCRWTGPEEIIKDEINPAEYSSLVFFNLSIITLTLTFTLIATQFGQSHRNDTSGEIHTL